MSILIRGTTPTIKYTFTKDLIDVNTMAVAYLTIKQRGVNIIEYDLTSATKDREDNCLTWALTQEDTLKLKQDQEVEIQVRYRLNDGVAGASMAQQIPVYKILKDGEI